MIVGINGFKMPEDCADCIVDCSKITGCPLVEIQQSEDCIRRQDVIDLIETCNSDGLKGIFCSYSDGERFEILVNKIKSAQPVAAIAEIHFDKDHLKEICEEHIKNLEHSTCKECRWWDSESGITGYCNAEKHIYYDKSWNIEIRRKTKSDFYCADFEERDND